MIKKWWKTTQVYIWWKIIFPDKPTTILQEAIASIKKVQLEFPDWEKEMNAWIDKSEHLVEDDWNKLRNKLTNNIMEDTTTNEALNLAPSTIPQAPTVASPATALEGIIGTLDNHNTNLTNTLNSYIATATKLAPVAFQAIKLLSPNIANVGATNGAGILDKVNGFIAISESILADIATVDSFIKTQI